MILLFQFYLHVLFSLDLENESNLYISLSVLENRPTGLPEWRSGVRHYIAVLRHHYRLWFDPKLCHYRP